MKKYSKNEFTNGYCGVTIALFHQLTKGEDRKIINPYENLCGGSNGFYEYHWDYKLIVSSNSLTCKDTVQHHHGYRCEPYYKYCTLH